MLDRSPKTIIKILKLNPKKDYHVANSERTIGYDVDSNLTIWTNTMSWIGDHIRKLQDEIIQDIIK